VPRARFDIDELVNLVLAFYKRNYIEGLFLSSGIIQTPDYTMEQIIEVARRLREVHDFRGYIHLKTIPEASPELLQSAGRYADRLSINIELARDSSLTALAPQKEPGGIRRSMAAIRVKLDESRERSEHRLYQADWLLRFYGFDVDEIISGGNAGMLDPALDPKLAWAIRHRERFPVDVNKADRETLLRVPGLGTRGVEKILLSRRAQRLRLEDLARLCGSVKRMKPFVVARDWTPGALLDASALRANFVDCNCEYTESTLSNTCGISPLCRSCRAGSVPPHA